MKFGSTETRQERLAEFAKGKFYLNPLLAAFFVICYLQLVERIVGALIGAAVGAALGATLAAAEQNNIDIIEETTRIVQAISPLLVILTSMILIVPISIYAAHRIKQFPVLWIVGGLALDQLVNLAVVGAILQLPIDIGRQLIFFVLLLPGAMIGWFWATRTQTRFIIDQIFRQLRASDQMALIDLAQTLPGASAS